jgi:hypothetical protein
LLVTENNNMDQKFTFESLLADLMQKANESYKGNKKLVGSAYLLGTKRPVPSPPGEEAPKAVLNIVHATPPVDTLEGLRRFSTAIGAVVRIVDAHVAAAVIELPVAVLDAADQVAQPVPSIIIYVDQKFGGLRVWVAPKEGENLIFRDLGNAHPATNFLPHLIPAEAYGPMADA